MTDHHSSSLINEGQLYGWHQRVRDIDEEIRTLSAERQKLERLIGMAEELSTEASRLAALRDDSSPSRFISEALDKLSPKDGFPKAVMAIVGRMPDGATYQDLKDAILRSPLADKFKKSDKGFYHALRRLKLADEIVDYHGYVFTPDNLKSFCAKVEAGVKADKEEFSHSSRGTKMTAMILEIVAENPGLIAKEVIEELCRRDDEIAERLADNDGSAYNAIARFKKRGEIEGFGHLERQLRIGPNASDEIRKLANSGVVIPLTKKNEAPEGYASDAS